MKKKILFSTALIMAFSASLWAQLPGLLQRFTFDNTYANTANTISFASSSGTYFTTDRFGATQALGINGNGTTAIINNLPLGASARSFSFWCNISNTNDNHVFNYGISLAAYGAILNGTAISAYYGLSLHTTSSTNDINTWNHYVLSYDGSTSKIYKNGVLISSQTATITTSSINAQFRLGLTDGGGTGVFSGAIDDLQMYNRALTETEVAQLYVPTLPSVTYNFNFDGTTANSTNTVSFSTSGVTYTNDRFGMPNKAIHLNGNGTTAILPNLSYADTQRTVSLWVNLSSFSNLTNPSFNFLFSYGSPSNPYGAYLNENSITQYGPQHVLSYQHVTNTWYHYVFTYDGQKTRIYRNGMLIGVKQQNLSTLRESNEIFRLGQTESGGSGYFSGAIDDLSIMNRCINANEVYALYSKNSTPSVQWNFTNNTSADGGLYSFSTPTGTGLNNDRFNNANSALFLSNSGSVATGVAALPLANSARTVSFWFKRSQSNFQELFVYGSSGSGNCYGMYVTANGSFVNYTTNNGSTYGNLVFTSNQPTVVDTWYFITVVHTQDSAKIYRNGVEVAAVATSAALTTTGTNLRLGMVLTTSQNPFQGTIDEIKVYNGALSPAEIAASYTASLPTHLNNFTAQLKNQTAQLVWDTKTETNTSHFEVEYSNNAKDFVKAASIQAAGNSSNGKQYNYSHTINNQSTHFYRLKMVDKDGSFTHSNIVKLNAAKTGIKAEVYPTIATSNINVNITATETSKATIQIISNDGKIVQQQTLLLQQGTQNKSIDVSMLTKGTYFVRVTTHHSAENFTIIKQ